MAMTAITPVAATDRIATPLAGVSGQMATRLAATHARAVKWSCHGETRVSR